MFEKKAALIVIDVQKSFRHMPYWVEEGFADYLVRQQALIDAAHNAGVPVVQIFHVRKASPFDPDTGFVSSMDGLEISPDLVVHKSRHSAFEGTALDIWLTQNGIGRLIISGLRTEQCCETTTRHGSDMGYDVDYVTEATHTFPMMHASGQTFSVEEIKLRTELVLADRFARIATVDEAIANMSMKEAAA